MHTQIIESIIMAVFVALGINFIFWAIFKNNDLRSDGFKRVCPDRDYNTKAETYCPHCRAYHK